MQSIISFSLQPTCLELQDVGDQRQENPQINPICRVSLLMEIVFGPSCSLNNILDASLMNITVFLYFPIVTFEASCCYQLTPMI